MKHIPSMRHPRTTAEARANQDGWERPRRRRQHLPNCWDDIWIRPQKSWKTKRKTQYHPEGRGEHHQLKIKNDNKKWFLHGPRSDEWKLEDYFRKHNIPYYIEKVMRFRWKEDFEWYWDGTVEERFIGDWSYKRKVYKRRYLGTYHRAYYIDHYVVHWWSDKDIGLEYIL